MLRAEIRVGQHRLEAADRLHLGEERLRARTLVNVEGGEDESAELVALRAIRLEPVRPRHRELADVEVVQRLEELAYAVLLVDERRPVDHAIDRERVGVLELRHLHGEGGGKGRQQRRLDRQRVGTRLAPRHAHHPRVVQRHDVESEAIVDHDDAHRRGGYPGAGSWFAV